ncbi:MAG: crotonase/enoyl-CoA hydratase family protein [Acidimicrobiia bacterium]|nr:crotonase/enoyl-CoA hydratase family protein [Acidimicrobiia bacterium]
MGDLSFEHIIYEVEGGAARITLNRPEKLNAISRQMLREMHDALWEADDDTSVHCVVLRGAGRAFCAGYDLAAAPESNERDGRVYRSGKSFDDDSWQLEKAQRLRMAFFDMHKPVISQVHGYCLAGGTDLVTLTDMVICAEDARFGFPPARDLGVLPTQMWLYHVGPQWSKRLLLTGDTVTGAEAAQIGLALKAVPADVLEAEVEQLVDRLTMVDRELLAANKRIINLGLELMGAKTLQRLAAETDARGHQAASAEGFRRSAREKGLREALRERDAKFGDGRARVDGPERRDERGYLVEE